jgi:phosphoglycolate phosphatase-like HAD superfamily hydrolase
MDSAVIFDVDGVLLELTRDEEELFFIPFSKRMDASLLSRDWNSYRIRNDEDIINEISEKNRFPESEPHRVKVEYLDLLTQSLKSQSLVPIPITGAADILGQLSGTTRLGIATANFRAAAKLRLAAANRSGILPLVRMAVVTNPKSSPVPLPPSICHRHGSYISATTSMTLKQATPIMSTLSDFQPTRNAAISSARQVPGMSLRAIKKTLR